MILNPLKFFAKDRAQETASAVKNATKKLKPKLKLVRDSRGRFVGKKSASDAKEKLVVKSAKKKPKESKTSPPPILKNSAFAGIPIRRFYTKGKWFFCIEDVVTLVGVPNIKEYLEQIKSKNEELQKDWEKMIEKFDYQIDSKTEQLECAEADNILKIVLALDKPLPGPFSRWLRETSQKIPA